MDFDFHEGAARAPLVHHGAPLAFSLAALRERRAAAETTDGKLAGRDPLVHGKGDGKGGADRPDVSVDGSSKYAAASFGVEPGPAREIVADEDGESPGGDSPGGAREASTGRDARRVGERSSDGGEGEEGGLGPALNEGGRRGCHRRARAGVSPRGLSRHEEVVGQFNLGFILCTLGDDLFIVDQHASDEIYNFERLQRTTTLNRQPLLVPKKLELTAAETQTVHRNMPTFLANGFGFCEVDQPPPTVRSLALNSVPFSKGITFGADDVHELIGMLDQGEYALPARSQLTVGLVCRQSTGTRCPCPRLSGRPGSAPCSPCARAARAS